MSDGSRGEENDPRELPRPGRHNRDKEERLAVFRAVGDEIVSRIDAAFGGAGASDPSSGAPVGRESI